MGDGGDMEKHMVKRREEEESKGGRLKEIEMLTYLLEIAKGLEYLSEKGIVHRDVALKNCLKSGSRIKVSDFGLSEQLREGEESVDVSGKKRDGRIAAPEVHRDIRHYRESDMWSMGVLIMSMSQGGVVRGHKDMADKDIRERVMEEGREKKDTKAERENKQR